MATRGSRLELTLVVCSNPSRPMIRKFSGSPSELHALDPFAPEGPQVTDGPRPIVWECEPTSPAIVLGSRQSHDVVDGDACRAAGLDVARRRSGGGAVLIIPDEMVWIDVVAPAGVFPDDVRASMTAVGECWQQALVDWGIEPNRLTVHRGGMVESAWSDLVCFAGVGPGEVLLDGHKLVGLSQRRTRHGVRVQGLLHLRSDLAWMRSLFAVQTPAEDLVEPACLAALDVAPFTKMLAARLAERAERY